MSQSPKKYLFSTKSLLVMCVLIALFGAANSMERSPYEGICHRGIPLTYRKTVTPGVTIAFSSFKDYRDWQEWEKLGVVRRTQGGYTLKCDNATFDGRGGTVTFSPQTTLDTSSLVLDLAIAVGLSALLALACERLVFKRFRAACAVDGT